MNKIVWITLIACFCLSCKKEKKPQKISLQLVDYYTGKALDGLDLELCEINASSELGVLFTGSEAGGNKYLVKSDASGLLHFTVTYDDRKAKFKPSHIQINGADTNQIGIKYGISVYDPPGSGKNGGCVSLRPSRCFYFEFPEAQAGSTPWDEIEVRTYKQQVVLNKKTKAASCYAIPGSTHEIQVIYRNSTEEKQVTISRYLPNSTYKALQVEL